MAPTFIDFLMLLTIRSAADVIYVRRGVATWLLKVASSLPRFPRMALITDTCQCFLLLGLFLYLHIFSSAKALKVSSQTFCCLVQLETEKFDVSDAV